MLSHRYSRRVLPPILEVFVVWHPDDALGEAAADALSTHFHGAAFAGLAGGAVEVYVRSEPWVSPGGPPRPMPFQGSLPYGLRPAQFTAVVPVLGTHLARAVDEDNGWRRYIETIAAADHRDGVGVYCLRDTESPLDGTALDEILSRRQALPKESVGDAAAMCRELSQAVAQRLDSDGGPPRRVTVFISHTKHHSIAEDDEDGPRLFERVRALIGGTRLGEFFDAHELQSGEDWRAALDDAASTSALLIVRTDRYAGREWTQREVLDAKLYDMPAVTLYALREGEARGSFLMDHLPAIPCHPDDPDGAITTALNRLVDEALKRALWRAQTVYLEQDGFDWLPAHAPEPATVAPWLRGHGGKDPGDRHVWVIHPDPPLGPKEREVVVELCALAGFEHDVDILTPRTFAARGGQLRSL